MTLDQDNGWTKPVHTGVLVLASGEVIEGFGLGAVGEDPAVSAVDGGASRTKGGAP